MLIADGVATNEDRADLGSRAVRSVVNDQGWKGLPAVTVIEDTLAYIAHLCDRYGLPPAHTFQEAIRRYHHRIEEGPGAERIANGDTNTLEDGYVAHRARESSAEGRCRAA